jgi:hypothetical protein
MVLLVKNTLKYIFFKICMVLLVKNTLKYIFFKICMVLLVKNTFVNVVCGNYRCLF